MESGDFFSFSSKVTSSNFQAHLTDLNVDHLKLIKGDYSGVDFPVIFKKQYGNKLNDVLDTGCVGLFLISDKLKMILEENHLTGWETFPVKVYDENENEITGYHGFSVTGRCKSSSFEKSEIIEKQLVPNGPVCKYYKGLFIDKWDGTDFFCSEKKCQIFTSKKSAMVLKRNKITNMQLENLAEYEIDVRHVR